MAEINHLMALDAGELTVHLSDDEAQIAQINLWLDTPKGQYWGRPAWGNRFSMFKHEPVGDANTFSAIFENLLLLDIRQDLPFISVQSIGVVRLEFDRVELTLLTSQGLLRRLLNF
jgi:hypothetical protein